MTTTAVRTPRPALRDGEVVHQRIAVAPRRRGTPPRMEDALRVGTMRRITAAKLRYCGLEDLMGAVMLIVSELVTNALLHSGTTEITVILKIEDGFLRITVIDGMPGHATGKPAGDDAESGRGLALVEMLATEFGGTWGTSAGGTETWCTLALPAEAS